MKALTYLYFFIDTLTNDILFIEIIHFVQRNL